MKREYVKQIALAMAKEYGLINLTRADLCDRSGIPDGSFINIMGCNFSELIEELKTEISNNPSHVVWKQRTDPELRREHILNTAVVLSISDGYHKITRDDVALTANVSTGLVSRYFGTMDQLRDAIIKTAIKEYIPEIIAQGIAQNDQRIKNISPELRDEAKEIIGSW